MSQYAKYTEVSSEKSKAEIERVLTKYGATSFVSGWSGNSSQLIFEAKGRRVKFILPLPERNKSRSQEHYDQLVRQKWRCMLLAIKAKLEVVESGIATFEEEFMAHVVLPNGDTVGKWMSPQINDSYKSDKMPILLGSGA